MVPEKWFSARMTIPGFLYLLSVAFILLRLYDINDLDFLQKFKEFGVYLTLLVVGASYLIGSLMNTLIVATLQSFLKPRDEEEATFVVRASDRLFNELQAKYSYVLLYRSLSLSLFCFGVGFAYWAWCINIKPSRSIVALPFVFFFAFTVAWLYLKHRFEKFRDAARALIQTSNDASDNVGSLKEK